MNYEKGLSGMLDLLTVMALGGQDRSDVFKEEIGDQTVDTVAAFDTGIWETGIERNGEWIIVQTYAVRDEAKAGHDEWVRRLKENPQMALKDVDLWGLDE